MSGIVRIREVKKLVCQKLSDILKQSEVTDLVELLSQFNSHVFGYILVIVNLLVLVTNKSL